jgi:hypothetical protein
MANSLNEINGFDDGPWMVWGDGPVPVAEDIDEESMKNLVDSDSGQNSGWYGENNSTGETYEGMHL